MNTYRGYVLDTSASEPENARLHVVYVRADKYGGQGGAWQLINASLNGEAGAITLFSDSECKVDAKLGHGRHLKCAKLEDIKPRNVKVDKAKIAEILGNAKLTPTEMVAQIKAATGGSTAATPAAQPKAA